MVNVPKLNDRQKEEIREKYAAGNTTIRQLAAEYDVSHITITRALKPEYVEREREENKARADKFGHIYQSNRKIQHLSFSLVSDADVIKKLEGQPNKSEYIRNLIRKDLGITE